jgi:ADP-ribose pyrophosphatase
MRILDTKTIAARKFLNLNETTYEDREGKEKTWTWAQRPGDQNAVVIAAMVDNLLVVTKEYRVPLKGYEWGLPAGLIDGGENPLEAAIREMYEETGLDFIALTRPISPLIFNSPGMTNEGIYMVFGIADGTIDSSKTGTSEDIKTYLYSRDEVQELLQKAMAEDSGIMIGAKAYLVFCDFVKHGTL